MASKKIAVVTGSNRGLGFETARELAQKGYHLVLTARDAGKGESALSEFKKQGLEAEFMALDVSNEKSIRDFGAEVLKRLGRVDVLVNNAGIMGHERGAGSSLAETSSADVVKTFQTNTLGAFLLSQALFPSMVKNNFGRIVNVSSGMGQLSEMGGGFAAYRISKTALNAVTRIFAAEAQGKNVLVNSVCPGWVKTDMGGPGAHRTIPEGADTIVWAATLPDGGPSGSFFRDRKVLAW